MHVDDYYCMCRYNDDVRNEYVKGNYNFVFLIIP